MPRRMISLTLSGDPEAWAAWLEHHRGSKTELVMLANARRGEAFHVWTRLPPGRPPASGVMRRLDAAKPNVMEQLKAESFHGSARGSADIDAIAVRLERKAKIEKEATDTLNEAKRGKDKREASRERALRRVQVGDAPSVGKHSDIGTIVVHDPFELAEVAAGTRAVGELKPRVKVVQLRDDPIGQMAKRDQITEEQLEAARRWQAWHDQAQLGSVRGIDPCGMKVDGGRFAEPISDVQRAALKRIVRADSRLGQVGAVLVRRVLGDRMSIGKVAAILGDTSERGVRYVGRRVSECLDTLVEVTGVVVEGASRPPPRDDAQRLASRHADTMHGVQQATARSNREVARARSAAK